ncbi:MAG: hypothetical protein ACR2JU_14195 [Nocardioidaceae bacterium]
MSDSAIARAQSPRGEVLLRRRTCDGELELRVNGVFVMDTLETSTERLLATLALEELRASRGPIGPGSLRVLVGGLGLGFTVVELARSPLVGQIVVAEIELALLEWHLAGLVPHMVEILRDPRVSVRAVDIRHEVEAHSEGSFDVIVLDVDNGPGFLVYDDNAALYEDGFLARCAHALTPGGKLLVWSGHAAPDLRNALERVFGSVDSHATAVTLGSRSDHYYAYVAPSRADGEGP